MKLFDDYNVAWWRPISMILIIVCASQLGHTQCFTEMKSHSSSMIKERYTIKPIEINKIKEILVENGLAERLEPSSVSSKYFTVFLTPEEFKLIKNQTLYYDFRSTLPHEESFLSDFFPEVNTISAAKLRFPSYFDHDIMISVKENDVSPDDIDLQGRVKASILSSGIERQHATDMATIIAGNGNTIYSSKGVMEKAQIFTTSFFNLLPDDHSFFLANNINVQNHSYGLEIEDYYGLEAHAYDDQVYKNPSIIHVFSAGNKGGESSIFSPYAALDGYANLTGTFKQSKNVLTIGGIDSFAVHLPGSSIGPAHDGRIKPELVAYGYNGTSDAAAITSGCAAATISALEQEGIAYDAGTVKAILVAGSDDLGSKGPDFQTGFGKVNLLNSLKIIKDKNIISGEIRANEILAFEIDIPDTSHVNLVLTWIDPPAEIDNDKALVNDLDIQILDSKGNLHLPFQMKYLPEEIASNLENSLGRDSINNIEMIAIDKAMGKLTIKVSSNNIIQNLQTFSIAFHAQDTFEFTYPYAGAFVQSGLPFQTTWSGYSSADVDYLEYRVFNIFDPYLSETLQEFQDTSAVVSGIAFTVDDRISEVEFIVADLPIVNIAWVCGDSVLITWTKKSFQDSFEILGLVGDGMSVIGITSKDYYLVDVSAYRYISIREKIGFTQVGPRSVALDLSNSIAKCFYERFSSSPLDDGLRLSLELNSSFFVNVLILEKYTLGKWSEIHVLDEALLSQFYDDLDLQKGENEYRVKIILEDGSEKFTEHISFFYIPSDEVLVFPTVLEADYGIDVWMGSYKPLEFNLLNGKGQVIIREKLLSEIEFFDTSHLSSGLYFYFLHDDNGVFSSGRIIIL